MIQLCDNRGVCIDHIEELLKDKNIGIMLSDGADSTMAFYLIAKYIDELNLHDSHTILPIHYHCVNENRTPPNDSITIVNGVVSIIRNLFPRVTIYDPVIKDYIDINDREMWVSKRIYWKDYRQRLLDSKIVDVILKGGISDPYDEEPTVDPTDILDDPILKRTHEKYKGPLMMADKRFVGWCYRKFNLMDTLYPLTKTCVFPDENGDPCKKCSGCQEKFYGFGCYDKGHKGGDWDERYSYYDYDVI